jgi:hypothetical protein
VAATADADAEADGTRAGTKITKITKFTNRRLSCLHTNGRDLSDLL